MIKEEGNSKEIKNNFNIRSIEIVNKLHRESIDDVICNIVKTEENKISKKESLLSQHQESISPSKKSQLIEMKSAKKTSKKISQVNKGDIINTSKKNFNSNGIRQSIILTEKSNHDNILKISQDKMKFEAEYSFPVMAGMIQKNEKKIYINETIGKKQMNTETIYNKIKDENMILKSKKKKKTGNLRRINSNSINRFLGRSLSTTNPLQTINDNFDLINEEWVITPVKNSNVISNKFMKDKKTNTIKDYNRNLKIDKGDVKTPGCCVSCV